MAPRENLDLMSTRSTYWGPSLTKDNGKAQQLCDSLQHVFHNGNYSHSSKKSEKSSIYSCSPSENAYYKGLPFIIVRTCTKWKTKQNTLSQTKVLWLHLSFRFSYSLEKKHWRKILSLYQLKKHITTEQTQKNAYRMGTLQLLLLWPYIGLLYVWVDLRFHRLNKDDLLLIIMASTYHQ
jgi:hypothetical protein